MAGDGCSGCPFKLALDILKNAGIGQHLNKLTLECLLSLRDLIDAAIAQLEKTNKDAQSARKVQID
ncbi:MAG: hypothetical protein HQK59_07195 [Deltaproteobacteria bacterium]|nr:hypothetical protein [Deltaproteobacteria bacterium]MBF0524177.1 hypothetical protein [Deltaproteobacteria bacterium]